jgi:heme/copper-type cytochrome/quinol oxidase subunit 2
MRKIVLALSALCAATVVAHDHGAVDLKEMLKKSSKHGAVIAQPAVIAPTATARTFNMVARSFQFDITPSPFVVDQGDTVTLNVSVPSNDSSPSGHGILMDTYIENAINVNKGQSRQIQFVATTAGTFAFVCTQSNCGIGHSSMFGQLVVNAVSQATPTVTAITPTRGSIKGGTAVTITGTNFATNATVRIGGLLATNVVVVNATTITAKAPKRGVGVVDVQVANGELTGTKSGAFTYTTDPVKKWSPK